MRGKQMRLFADWEPDQDDHERDRGLWYARGALRPFIVVHVRGGVL